MKRNIRKILIFTTLYIFFCIAVCNNSVAFASDTDINGMERGNIISVTSVSYNSLKIKWDNIEKADGYKLYRSTEKDGYYKFVKRITDINVHSYTDKGLSNGKKYFYKIRGYQMEGNREILGKASEGYGAFPRVSVPETFKVDGDSHDSLSLSWSKVTGADGYRIYRSTSANGTYKKVGVVRQGNITKYIDEGITLGKVYYYKVTAYRYSGDDVIAGNATEDVSCQVVPYKGRWTEKIEYYVAEVYLDWMNIAGADGYQIYRSNSSSSGYTLVKEMDSEKSYWKDSGLDKSRTYYYKVRGFAVKNGKKIYGEFSSVYRKKVGGWKYTGGYKLFYDTNRHLVKDIRGIIGSQSSYVIKVNKKMNTVTVYARDGEKGYIIPVVSFVCSAGNPTPLGTFYIPAKFRWLPLIGNVFGQWSVQIKGNYLFHSVYYYENGNNKTLSVDAYNKLGTTQSAGCVRLTAGDCKWIYDNCGKGTKVVIYNGTSSGPLGKPNSITLPSWHTWDPTDPTAEKYCDQRGCH